MRSLRDRVWVATASPLDATGLQSIEDAFASWVEAIGARRSPLQGASATLRSCHRLGDQVEAGYALWWDHTPDGKRWWVQIVINNETARRYWVDLDGTMWVAGLIQPMVGRVPYDKERGGRQIVWGGSSADSMYAYPSTTTSRRIGLTEFVYTTSEGVVYDVRPNVFVFHSGHNCSLPVPRLN